MSYIGRLASADVTDHAPTVTSYLSLFFQSHRVNERRSDVSSSEKRIHSSHDRSRKAGLADLIQMENNVQRRRDAGLGEHGLDPAPEMGLAAGGSEGNSYGRLSRGLDSSIRRFAPARGIDVKKPPQLFVKLGMLR